MPVGLAKRVRAAAPSRTWATLPGADCRPGDAIEISGYRLGYDDRGFPKQSTSTMRFRVEIVDTFNRINRQ